MVRIYTVGAATNVFGVFGWECRSGQSMRRVGDLRGEEIARSAERRS